MTEKPGENENPTMRQWHEKKGFTVLVYFPPEAPWEVVEAFEDRVADDAFGIERETWDPAVAYKAGDHTG